VTPTYLIDDPDGDVTLFRQAEGEPTVAAVERTTHPDVWRAALLTLHPVDCREAR
jgi:hypothetical protein